MIWLMLADAIVVIHLAFILFVIAGGLLLLRWPRLVWLHIPAVIWGALTEFLHIVCPLTDLEDRLRGMAGVAGYRSDFVTHYLLPVIYPPGLTAQIQLALGSLVVLLNIGVYGWLLWRLPRWRHNKEK
ncbi:MAG TPA: DUF2784 domain-containing protein [Gammaproteobacteria bacterium]|nr:DUF2784 domain-containing protein [Gammaproteobacteria bacterium]